jgi:hypothetical protein
MPRPRPNPANVAVPTLIRLQPGLARPWPTVMLGVGNSESVRHLAVIRDRVLGHHTQVNVFVGISYNRNKTRNSDSWWACLAIRNINPPNPPANAPATWPACTIIGEIPKTPGGRYQRLKVPFVGNTVIWSVPTAILFHPEPIPVLQPPLPQSFDLDLEPVRQFVRISETAFERLGTRLYLSGKLASLSFFAAHLCSFPLW